MAGGPDICLTTFTSTYCFQQGNVIVLDLSQEHAMSSSSSTSNPTTSTTLSELLQASGILAEDNNDSASLSAASCRVGSHDSHEVINHRPPQQVLLQQRIPADKCKSIYVLDSINLKFSVSFERFRLYSNCSFPIFSMFSIKARLVLIDFVATI